MEARPGRLRGRLREGPSLLLDAAMGTELERRGVESRLPLWSARALMDAPETVRAIHRENVDAGAEILTANTFRTHRRTLALEGLADRAAELTGQAVALAREEAAGARRSMSVVGSLSPLEDCYRPDLVPADEELRAEHAAQAQALAAAGVDGILVETQNTIRELDAAVNAAKATGLPVIASMVTDGCGRLLSGESIEDAGRRLAELSPDAIGVNCVAARRLAGDLQRLCAAAPGIPISAYGNVTRFAGPASPEEYSGFAALWIALGARLVGGCCGTTAAHTAALQRLLSSRA